MKIKKISIVGMHKIAQKTYDLNDLTYFIGPNGAGKSTILEAIQLAILGYIPGYAKTNESIMKHASGKMMEVSAELDSGIVITRTWMRSGSSVKSEIEVKGYEGEIADLLSGVELPVLDFNEFRSMTANKLKEWFISFLPNSDDDFNVIDELRNAIEDRSIPIDDLVEETQKWIEANPAEGIELIKNLNNHFKEDQSYYKGQVAKLQGTIQSLIRYDDAPDVDAEVLNSRYRELNEEKNKTMQVKAQADAAAKLTETLTALQADLQAESFDTDPRVLELKKNIEDNKKQVAEMSQQLSKLKEEQMVLSNELTTIPSAKSVCPYTNEQCQTAANLASKYQSQFDEVSAQLAAKEAEIKEFDISGLTKLQMDTQILQGSLNDIQNQYDRVTAMKLQTGPEVEEGTFRSIDEINAEIDKINQDLIKVEANKRYEALTETVTRDKFELENNLEVLKVWIKLTDANGLQTKLMNGPFESLAEDMSRYLTEMFDKPTEAQFNLEAKANSFSFGLIRDGQYIQFDYLSSGERCLFTLALMMCILNRSDSQIRTILIDDILDHLDDSNAESLFNSLKKINDIQFILAGVQDCSDSSLCYKVE